MAESTFSDALSEDSPQGNSLLEFVEPASSVVSGTRQEQTEAVIPTDGLDAAYSFGQPPGRQELSSCWLHSHHPVE